MGGKRNFEVGAIVYARWPGSAKFYEATVDEILDDEYRVTFKDGSTSMDVGKQDVYSEHFFNFGRRRSRSSSPGRSRSPGRRRSRSRSPARKTSTPKRKTSESPRREKRSAARTTRQLKTEKASPKDEKDVKDTPVKPPQVQQTRSRRLQQETTSTRITRSLTKTLMKEEKEALFDKNKLEEDMKEKSKRSKKRGYEFGGPIGALFFMISLPALTYAFYFFCTGKNNSCTFTKYRQVELPKTWKVYFNGGSVIVVGWILFQAIMYAVPVGRIAQGVNLPDGTRLDYRINGFMALVFTIAVFLLVKSKNIPITFVYHKFPALITTAVIVSVLVAVFAYIKARREGTGLSPTGNTGNVLYDFFVGHQLNPRIGIFDLKFFFELRPGLIGWIDNTVKLFNVSFIGAVASQSQIMINFCMANQEYETFHSVSPAMILVCAFQFVYVIDALIFEASILTTIDIIHEGFGLMLSFGNIVFVPFMFSIQARYLADHQVQIAWPFIIAIVAVKVIGFIIFRGSNLQKDFFKNQPNDPDFKDKETILTASGRRLMVFGWWKLVRHPNYLGDILMAVSWSLTCGFSHLIPWFYPTYLIILLIHRQRRVEALCLNKYGKSYEEYCRRVPYRIFPLLY